MSRKKIIFSKFPGKHLQAFIDPVSNCDGFDKLIQYMKNEFSVKVIDSFDGPAARRWILESEGIRFELIYDDGCGNYLLAPTIESETIVKKIGSDLETRFAS